MFAVQEAEPCGSGGIRIGEAERDGWGAIQGSQDDQYRSSRFGHRHQENCHNGLSG